MADAYGAVVLSKSDDCKLDEEKLLMQLNELRWSNGDHYWEINEKDHAFVYSDNAQYPTVSFEKPVTLEYKDENDVVQQVPYNEATQEQHDNIWDSINEPMSLADLEEHFRDCVLKGSITLAATSNEKCRYVTYEAFTLNADGDINYVQHFVGTSPWYGTRHIFEEYSRG